MLTRLIKSRLTGEVLEAELRAILGRIFERSQPSAIVLFGSAAHDRMTEASDLDLALIYETFEEAEKGRVDVLSVGPLSAWPVDLIFVDRQTFREKRALGGVYAKICEGRPLFPDQLDWKKL